MKAAAIKKGHTDVSQATLENGTCLGVGTVPFLLHFIASRKRLRFFLSGLGFAVVNLFNSRGLPIPRNTHIILSHNFSRFFECQSKFALIDSMEGYRIEAVITGAGIILAVELCLELDRAGLPLASTKSCSSFKRLLSASTHAILTDGFSFFRFQFPCTRERAVGCKH
jgi:hypothetical protein